MFVSKLVRSLIITLIAFLFLNLVLGDKEATLVFAILLFFTCLLTQVWSRSPRSGIITFLLGPIIGTAFAYLHYVVSALDISIWLGVVAGLCVWIARWFCPEGSAAPATPARARP